MQFQVANREEALITQIILSNGVKINLTALERLVCFGGLSLRRVAEILGVSDVELERTLRALRDQGKLFFAVSPRDVCTPLTQEDLDWATDLKVPPRPPAPPAQPAFSAQEGLDWATNEIDRHAQQQLLAHLKTLCETVQMLHDRIGQRDRLIGRLEEFIQEYVPFNNGGRLEEMLRAIANLYGDKDAQ